MNEGSKFLRPVPLLDGWDYVPTPPSLKNGFLAELRSLAISVKIRMDRVSPV